MTMTRKIFIFPVTVLLMTGCAVKPSYEESIIKFQDASAIVVGNAKDEYEKVNKSERNAEIDKRVNNGERIDPSILGDKGLIVINQDALEARLAALDALTKHGTLLMKLVNSSAPDEAKTAVTSFNDAVIKLSGSLGNAPPEAFKNKAGAFASIAGEVTKLVMDKKIKEALGKAIKISEEHVSVLITLLKEDMLVSLPAIQEKRLSAARVAAADAYNDILKNSPSDLEKRKKAGEEIKKAEDVWEAASTRHDPGFEKMLDAHKKLVKYAKGTKTPKDLAELTEAMNRFADEAKILTDAIKTIHE